MEDRAALRERSPFGAPRPLENSQILELKLFRKNWGLNLAERERMIGEKESRRAEQARQLSEFGTLLATRE